jgi:hypothetical protein
MRQQDPNDPFGAFDALERRHAPNLPVVFLKKLVHGAEATDRER